MAVLAMTLSAHAQTERRIYTSSEFKAMQDRAKKQKLTREQRRQLQAAQDSVDFVNAYAALENLNFVMEAERLIFKRGETAIVSPITNFISLKDDKAVVQIAPFRGPGANGVGGITLTGKATNIKIKTNKRGVTTFSMDVIGRGISAIIELNLYQGGNKADVLISPLFNSEKLKLDGNIVPCEESRIFQGHPF